MTERVDMLDRLYEEGQRLELIESIREKSGAECYDPRLKTAVRAVDRKVRRELRKFSKSEREAFWDMQCLPFN